MVRGGAPDASVSVWGGNEPVSDSQACEVCTHVADGAFRCAAGWSHAVEGSLGHGSPWGFLVSVGTLRQSKSRFSRMGCPRSIAAMATKKTSAKAPAKRAPAKKSPAKKSPAKKASPARGPALVDAIHAALTGPESPVGQAQPLDEAQLLAAEHAAGVALSPALHALLSFDAGYMRREYGWFDGKMKLLARPLIEIIGGHAGPFTEMYAGLVAQRFPGKALPLDQGSDSMRILYLGDPDAQGEYPVLFIDHDDVPVLGVQYPGFDAWLGTELGVTTADFTRPAAARCTELLGVDVWEAGPDEDAEYPPAVPGPAPGSIPRAPRDMPAAPAADTKPADPAKEKKEKKLTDKQLQKAIVAAADDGDVAALGGFIAQVKERKLDALLDEALMAAAASGQAEALRMLLVAGGNPNVKGTYGSALSRVGHFDKGPELLRILLDAGAKANGPSINGEQVLHGVVQYGSLEAVEVLLDAGANVNHCDSNGRTPLFVAASSHASGKTIDPAVIDLLVARGADPNGGKTHTTPLHVAIDSGLDVHMERLLDNGAALNAKAKYLGRTPLVAAYATGRDELVHKLLARGADRSIADDDGLSLETIVGPRGEDVRAVEAHYAGSASPQTLVVEAKLAVLNYYHVGAAGRLLSVWTKLIERGLAAGAEFDPTTSRARTLREPDWNAIRSNGFHTVTWELEVAGVSPLFMGVIAKRLMAFYGTLRGAGITIRGSLAGSGLDSAGLRALLDGQGVPLGRWDGPRSFDFRVEQGNDNGVRVVTKSGEPAMDALYGPLGDWLQLAPSWGGFVSRSTPAIGMPTKKSGGAFPIVRYGVGSDAKEKRLGYDVTQVADSLENTMRVIAAQTPLESATLVYVP